MTASGQKRTFRDVRQMSATPPKADKCCGAPNVRYVPLATNAPQQTVSLFDYLVGAPD